MPGLRNSRWTNAVRLGALAGGLLIGCLAPAVASAVTPSTPTVNLGTASTYAVLSGVSVANTASAAGFPHTILRGDLGVKANAQPAGFPPGEVRGTIRVGNAAAAQAHADLATAYAEVAARTGGAPLAGALTGATISPGLHAVTGAVSNTGTVTLDGGGNPNAVFVFQVNAALAVAAGSHVKLINGARASRVFWQVEGAGSVGANADFAGALMASAAVTIGNGVAFNGRAFARDGAMTLDANEFYGSPPVVAIAGGASATTTDTTPTISGTTDVEAPGVVSVTFAGQTLSATPSDGTWSVSSAIQANGTYPVVASVSDAVGNPGSATQQLTIDTVLPIVTLDDGPSVITNDPTPTISGTSDAAADTVVRVTVDSQSLRALVHAGGAWNIRPAPLTDGTRTVTASVTDPAGNVGTDSRLLTVDTVAPAVTIAGGPTALTNDPTPTISGTAAVASGTTVTVTLADETLSTAVGGGAWSVTAAELADGPHRVAMSVSDAAGNAAAFSQTLTVDTVSPIVAINGGATATTRDLDPTIVGTSGAAPGTTVTVSIAGQTMTTLLQANGTWNATPTRVGEGTWPVVASAPDPAGNVGSAGQSLTIAGDAPEQPGAAGTTLTPLPSAVPSTTPTPMPRPAPAPEPTPAADDGGSVNAVPATTVTRDAVQKVRGYSLSIATKVTAPAKGRVVATATGTVRIAGVAKAIALTTARANVAAGRSATLRLKPKGPARVAAAAFDKIRRAVESARKVTATITVRIVDAARHTRVVRRTVKLTM